MKWILWTVFIAGLGVLAWNMPILLHATDRQLLLAVTVFLAWSNGFLFGVGLSALGSKR